MLPRIDPVRRRLATPLLAAAGLLAAAAPGSLAQDCRLIVEATPRVISTGQSAQVNVHAAFPAAMYAFASAAFDVYASMPAWTFASGGVFVGDDVMGIVASQKHEPQVGNPADPSNPIRVWTGLFTPTSAAPALVEFESDPASFAVYPSELTPSWIPCDAAGTRDWVFVNPVTLGDWAAAPGAGTTIEPVGDGFVAQSPQQAILIGMLLPAVKKIRSTSARLSFDQAPDSLTMAVQVQRGGFPTESISVSFAKVDIKYDVRTGLPPDQPVSILFENTDGSVERMPWSGSELPFQLAEIPETVGASKPPSKEIHIESFSWGFSQAGGLQVYLMDGSVRTVSRVSVSWSVETTHNLKQLGLGAHTIEALGASKMTVIPAPN